jgi:hypothetical protein
MAPTNGDVLPLSDEFNGPGSCRASFSVPNQSDGLTAAQTLRLRLVTSQGSPYLSRSPRAHPSGWTRTLP